MTQVVWSLLCVHLLAKQLDAYHHLLYWTMYIRKHAWTHKEVTNVKADQPERGEVGAIMPGFGMKQTCLT